MLMSHDSLTGEKAVNPIMNLFKRWWKCQDKNLAQQYRAGVNVFDIRVCYHKSEWWGCHGLCRVNFHKPFISNILDYFRLNYPDTFVRIILERGSNSDQMRFIQEVNLCKYMSNLWRVDIKSPTCQYMGEVFNNNYALKSKGYLWAEKKTWELPWCHEIHGSVSKDNWYKVNLKKEAEKLKAKYYLRSDILNQNTLYTLDFV